VYESSAIKRSGLKMTFAVFAAEDVLRKAAQGLQVNPLDFWIAENKVAAARRLEREQEIAEREEALRSPCLDNLRWVPGQFMVAA